MLGILAVEAQMRCFQGSSRLSACEGAGFAVPSEHGLAESLLTNPSLTQAGGFEARPSNLDSDTDPAGFTDLRMEVRFGRPCLCGDDADGVRSGARCAAIGRRGGSAEYRREKCHAEQGHKAQANHGRVPGRSCCRLDSGRAA
jgi:hypothetical protein